jgi:hypothetical protein
VPAHTDLRQTLELCCTAYHEAAHAVAAHFSGVNTSTVTIRPGTGTLGHHVHDVVVGPDIEWNLSDRNRVRAERLALICLAGPSATRRCLAIANRRDLYNGAQHASDYDDAIAVLSYFSGGLLLEKHVCYMEARADALVEHRWWAITAVAEALLEHITLKGPAVRQVITKTARSRAQLRRTQLKTLGGFR